jgi:spore maturation protein CgeB
MTADTVGGVWTCAADHTAFHCTPPAVLNVSRESMARYGFSPATRVFEAAGAAACLITDAWEGLELFFAPGEEVLGAHDGDEVAQQLRALDAVRARAIGQAAYRRVLAEHTYAHRAAQVDGVLQGCVRRGPVLEAA